MTKPAPITAARQDDILRRYQFCAPGVVLVQAVRRTEPLLEAAGFRPLRHEWYPVAVATDYLGRLVIAER